MSKNKTGASVQVRIELVSDLIDVHYSNTLEAVAVHRCSCNTGAFEVYDGRPVFLHLTSKAFFFCVNSSSFDWPISVVKNKGRDRALICLLAKLVRGTFPCPHNYSSAGAGLQPGPWVDLDDQVNHQDKSTLNIHHADWKLHTCSAV